MISKLMAFIIMGLIWSCNSVAQVKNYDQDLSTKQMKNKNLQEATFGAGCFWCVEAVFQELNGVEKVESGYMGGHVANPTYKQVCSGKTGHAEVARIIYDPEVISYKTLLEVFWTTHDPTTLNQQGYDKGTQYRSVVFYHNPAQKSLAEKLKDEYAKTLWEKEVVTEITPVSTYYPAEDYHQNYFSLNPEQGYCRAVINPKIAKFRKRFNDKLKPSVSKP